jgi:hypothetical protein
LHAGVDDFDELGLDDEVKQFFPLSCVEAPHTLVVDDVSIDDEAAAAIAA